MTLTRLGAVAALLAVLAGGVAVLRRSPASPILSTIAIGSPPWFMFDVALDTHAGRAVIGGDSDQRIYVVDTHTGTLLRTVSFTAAPTGPRYIMMGEHVVVDEREGRAFMAVATQPPGLAVLDTRSERLIRVLPISGISGAYMGLDARTHHLFQMSNGSPDEEVSMRDAATGRLLYTADLVAPTSPSSGYSWSGDTMPLLVDGPDKRVFVSHFDSNAVSVLDTRHGRLLRTVVVAPPPQANNGVDVASPVLDAYTHRVFVSSGPSGTVIMLDARSGRVLRTTVIGGFAATPVVDERTNRVVVATSSGLDMLDARTGRILSRVSLAGGLGSLPVVDPRTGLMAAADRAQETIDVFDGHSGRLLHATTIGGSTPGSGTAPAVDTRGGHVLVVRTGTYDWGRNAFAGNASLVVLDLRSGHVRRTLTLNSVGGGRVLVDDREGRALALLSGGPAVAEPDPYGWLPSWLRRRLLFLPRPPARTRMAPATLTVLDLARL